MDLKTLHLLTVYTNRIKPWSEPLTDGIGIALFIDIKYDEGQGRIGEKRQITSFFSITIGLRVYIYR